MNPGSRSRNTPVFVVKSPSPAPIPRASEGAPLNRRLWVLEPLQKALLELLGRLLLRSFPHLAVS